MNKRTRAIDEDTYKLIIATMKNGFSCQGVHYKPNERIATVLVLEYNLGLRVGDILNLCVDSFVKDGSRYRLDIYTSRRLENTVISQYLTKCISSCVIMLMLTIFPLKRSCSLSQNVRY